MPGSILHTVSDEFDARNAFLQVTLGALGFVTRFDALLARHGVVPARVPPTVPTAVPAADDHPLPYLVLGLVAMSRQLRAAADAARGPVPPPPAPRPSPSVAPRTLLA